MERHSLDVVDMEAGHALKLQYLEPKHDQIMVNPFGEVGGVGDKVLCLVSSNGVDLPQRARAIPR